MNCVKCKSYLDFVCLDCSEEVCFTCDKKSKHLTHSKQKISCITQKCEAIKVSINDQKQFDLLKNDLSTSIEQSMKVLESLSEIQLKFQKMVQDAEYHCELKRLARKFEEGLKKKQDDVTQQDTIQKIMTKSKKCGFNLSDSYQEKHLSLNEIQLQLSGQQKISKQLEAEIKKLQDRIEGNKLFSINRDEIDDIFDDDDLTAQKSKNKKTLLIQEDEEDIDNDHIQANTSIKKRVTPNNNNNINNNNRKRKGADIIYDEHDNDGLTPKSKLPTDQSTLKINKADHNNNNNNNNAKNAPSPLLIKKLKKNLQQLY